MMLMFPETIEPRSIYQLVEALLECDCLKTPAARDQVIGNLPTAISAKITRFPNAKQDVMGLVNTCRQFDEGMQQLYEAIKFFEDETSLPWRNLQTVTQQILSAVKSIERLDALGAILSGGALPASTLDQVRRGLEDEKRRHGQNGESRTQSGYLDEVMHHINFTRLEDFLRHGEQHYTRDGFAALCVVQQSDAMGGRWGLKRIQSWLKTEGKQPKEVDIRPIDREVMDPLMIVNRLVTAFEVDSGELMLKGIPALTKKICGTFHRDRRILITIPSCEEFSEDTWHWLLQEFWCSLLKEFRQSENCFRVRLLIVLQTDLPLDSNTIVAHCCDADTTFNQAKLARLPLDHWTEEELLIWLTDYWGENRTLEDLKELARKIFLASNQGQPSLIYSQCQKRLVREVR
jgi:hypothetical protein